MKHFKAHWVYLLWGGVFGWLLSRSGATDFQLIAEMFLLKNIHLYGVIGLAIAVGLPGFYILQKLQKAKKIPKTVPFPKRRFVLGTWAGSIFFGIGWGLTGTCPGTAVSQFGEGRLIAGFTIAGSIFGAWLFGVLRPRFFGDDVEVCG